MISEDANVILPWHIARDKARDSSQKQAELEQQEEELVLLW